MLKRIAGAMTIVACMALPGIAQQGGIKRTPLGTIEFPPGFTTVTVIAELAPGICSGRHTHPGIESGYVMEGEFVLKVDGRPDQTLKAGQWFENPANMIHDVCSGPGVKVLSTYVIERGKPLASPAR